MSKTGSGAALVGQTGEKGKNPARERSLRRITTRRVLVLEERQQPIPPSRPLHPSRQVSILGLIPNAIKKPPDRVWRRHPAHQPTTPYPPRTPSRRCGRRAAAGSISSPAGSRSAAGRATDQLGQAPCDGEDYSHGGTRCHGGRSSLRSRRQRAHQRVARLLRP